MSRRRGHQSVRVPGRLHAGALLLTRPLRRDPWVSILLAVVVLVVSLLATAWPRLVLDMSTRQVSYVMDSLSAVRRDVTGTATASVLPPRAEQAEPSGAGEEDWSLLQDNLESVVEDQPEPLRSVVQGGGVHVDLMQTAEGLAPSGASYGALEVTLRVDPGLADHVDLVRGQWPAAMVNQDAVGGFSLLGVDPGRELPDIGDYELIQVALLDEAARELNWEVGERWGGLRLTGTYAPRDADDPRWAHAVNSVSVGSTAAQGALTAQVTGYLAPTSSGAVDTAPGQVTVRAALPLDVSALRGDQVDDLLTQLEQLSSAQTELLPAGPVGPTADPVDVSLDTEAFPTIRQIVAQQQTSASLLAVIAAGPIGVTLAVLLLGTRLIRSRRAGTVGLAVARGASPRQVRGLLAVEGLLVGLPAAALGYLAASWLLPTSTGASELVLAGVVGLLPALALVLTRATGTVREVRRDLRSRTGSRVRAVGEVGLVLLAALAVWRLVERGLAGVSVEADPATESVGGAEAVGGVADGAVGAGVQMDTGVDPLLAATPVLLALVACVITMRLYPLLVRLLLAWLRKGRALTGFLGAARALRDPAAGVLPALSVILGVAVGVSSVVLASTVQEGASVAVWESAGAQVRASGPTMGPEVREALRDIDGVAEVGTAREIDRPSVLSGGISAEGVRIVVIDDEMQQVSADAGPLPPLPAELFEVRSPAPVVTLGALTPSSGQAQLRTFGEVEVIGHQPALPGVRTRGQTLVMSVGNWEAVQSRVSSGTMALVSLTGAVPAEQVTSRVAATVPTALVETPELAEQAFRAAPITSGLLNAFLVAVGVSAGLTALAILLAHFMGSVSRGRMLAVLRTLGMPPGQGRSLTAWEFGPLVATALVVGAATGALVSWVLVRAVDLTGLTGGAAQPELAVDGALLTLVLGAVVVTMVATITVSAILAARSDLAQQLRIGDEG